MSCVGYGPSTLPPGSSPAGCPRIALCPELELKASWTHFRTALLPSTPWAALSLPSPPIPCRGCFRPLSRIAPSLPPLPSAPLQATFQAQQAAPFVCPVTGVEANGRARFAVLRKCGTVVSEKALKQVTARTTRGAGTLCPCVCVCVCRAIPCQSFRGSGKGSETQTDSFTWGLSSPYPTKPSFTNWFCFCSFVSASE